MIDGWRHEMKKSSPSHPSMTVRSSHLRMSTDLICQFPSGCAGDSYVSCCILWADDMNTQNEAGSFHFVPIGLELFDIFAMLTLFRYVKRICISRQDLVHRSSELIQQLEALFLSDTRVIKPRQTGLIYKRLKSLIGNTCWWQHLKVDG